MRGLIAVVVIAILGAAAWKVGEILSTDAIGMLVGLIFGVLAGVPSALLVLATNRQREEDEDSYYAPPSPPPFTPPVQITVYTVAHPFGDFPGNAPALPAPPPDMQVLPVDKYGLANMHLCEHCGIYYYGDYCTVCWRKPGEAW